MGPLLSGTGTCVRLVIDVYYPEPKGGGFLSFPIPFRVAMPKTANPPEKGRNNHGGKRAAAFSSSANLFSFSLHDFRFQRRFLKEPFLLSGESFLGCCSLFINVVHSFLYDPPVGQILYTICQACPHIFSLLLAVPHTLTRTSWGKGFGQIHRDRNTVSTICQTLHGNLMSFSHFWTEFRRRGNGWRGVSESGGGRCWRSSRG